MKQIRKNSIKMSRTATLLLFSLLSIFSYAADPIEGTGVITGYVTTTDGKPAVEVTVLIKGTSRFTLTDEAGKFEFRKLQAGE